MAVRGGELVTILVALGALAVLFLLFTLWLARKARKPPARKPPRKTFEHGRRLGRARRPLDTDEAVAALKACPVGDASRVVVGAREVEVYLTRRKSQPCVQAVGYLAGLFESAWAHEVVVVHPDCAGARGGACHYLVQRASIPIAGRAAEAPTRGSAGARRRSPSARPGGG